ncbi:VWA domain-containing protein [Gemmatimonas aurantiaca]|uniref:vWA domain-containing protein n=1 Tax=Gemmatimonas aurantiaca TaxID=173480 RepID=UPI00301D7E82
MAFLAPAFLALAALAGVPLLVHLLRRRIGRTVDFPAVRYLMRMEQEHSRDLKLRNRLLLLLRILAVLALALAAARPIARLFGVGHAPMALAVVLDNSMSTGVVHDGRMLFDSLRADAGAVLGQLASNDRAWIVTADGRVIGGTPNTLQEALATLTPLGGRGDLALATQRAVGLARSGAPRTPVVAMVSDGQPSSFRTDSVVDVANVPLVLLHHGVTSAHNRSIVSAEPSPIRWTPGGDVSLAIVSPDSAAWRLTLDGRTVARGTTPAATAQAPARVTQRLASTANGWVRGSVELDADDLRADDTRWFAVRVAPPPAVSVRTQGGPFLSAALGTLVDEGRLARGADGDPRVVNVAGADADGTRKPVLLTAPADPLQVGAANRQLVRLGIPWRFGALARGSVVARVPARGATRATADSTSPTALAFDGTPVRWRFPLVYSPGSAAASVAPAPGAAPQTAASAAPTAPDTVATAGGTPWVVAGDGYVLIGSPLDPDATDLPLKAAFVPWLLEALARRLGDDGRLITAAPGATVTGLRDVTALERQDGTLIPTSGDRVTVPGQAGVYFLRRQAARVGALVVNGEPAESELSPVGTAPVSGGTLLASLARGKDLRAETTVGAWQRTVFSLAEGQALLLPLVALALLALIAEAWISGR